MRILFFNSKILWSILLFLFTGFFSIHAQHSSWRLFNEDFETALQQKGEKGFENLKKDWSILGNTFENAQVKVWLLLRKPVSNGIHLPFEAQWIQTIGNLHSALIPIQWIPRLKSLDAIAEVYIDRPVQTKLKEAKNLCGIDSIEIGHRLQQKYTGKNVVVGIIDIGFQFHHPTFMDSTGTRTRIKRVWIPFKDSSIALRPQNFGYGTELTNANDILQYGYSSKGETHGTHVASIAAGSGYLKPALYKGIAPQADIVFVDIENGGTSTIADGIAYILQYAQSVGKRAVINLSLGYHIGPHDGTTPFDRALKQFKDQGAVIVGSAGNEGEGHLHIRGIFNGTGKDTIRTLISTDEGYSFSGRTYVNVWGRKNKSFSFQVKVYNAQKRLLKSFPIRNTKQFDAVSSFRELYTGTGGNLNIILTGQSADTLNQKPELLLEMNNQNNSFIVALQIISNETDTIDAWNAGYQNQVSNFTNRVNTFVGSILFDAFAEGDSLYTVAEIGGISPDIFTVGAYTSKALFQSMNGNMYGIVGAKNGSRASFSSIGPTADDRMKPNACAPGMSVVAAFSRENIQSFIGHPRIVDTSFFQQAIQYYGALEGSSMSSAMVTGIAALMLECNPNISATEIFKALEGQCTIDTFTQHIPTSGSVYWGRGKINAYKSIQLIEQQAINNIEKQTSLQQQIRIFPNPTSLPLVWVEGIQAPFSYRWYNALGTCLEEKTNTSAGTMHSLQIPVSNSSIVWLQLHDSAGKISTFKVIQSLNFK